MRGLKKEFEYPSQRKTLFQTGGMSHEHSGMISSARKKGIQQSTNTPIRMPTIRAALLSFCSLHVSPSVWNDTVAWRTVKAICGCRSASFTWRSTNKIRRLDNTFNIWTSQPHYEVTAGDKLDLTHQARYKNDKNVIIYIIIYIFETVYISFSIKPIPTVHTSGFKLTSALCLFV